MARAGSYKEGRFLVLVAGVDLGVLRQKQSNHIGMAALCCAMQGRFAVCVPGVNVGTGLDKAVRNL